MQKTNEPLKPIDPCYCGSRKQYRKCCMKHDEELCQADRDAKYYAELTFLIPKTKRG